MALGDFVPVGKITEEMNIRHLDVKRALKLNINEIRTLLADYADPDEVIITIDGVPFNKDTDIVALGIALQTKMDQLTNKSTTILGIFDALLKLESKLIS